MNPYRGFVRIADEVLAAAREVARTVVDAALQSAEEERAALRPPVQRLDGWSRVVAQLAAEAPCRKWTAVEMWRHSDRRASRVNLRCRSCGSVAFFDVSDATFLLVDSDDRRSAFKLIKAAINDAGCYCVERNEP